MRHWWILVITLIALLLAGCAGAATPTDVPTQAPAAQQPAHAPGATEKEPSQAAPTEGAAISVAGSTTVQPLAELFAEAFTAQHPEVEITVQGGGSGVGVKSAGEGTVDVGMASREIKQEELTTYADMKVFVIARDGIAAVVHPDVTVEDLTVEQVRGIFSGEIANWSEVGGPDRAILVVSREEGSGTRAAFEEMVMGEDARIVGTAILQPSNGAVRTTVATTPDAIGFLSFGYLDESVKALKVAGVEPNEANAASGSYPVVRPLNMMTKGEPTGAVKAWLDYILSAEGQAVVKDEGYLPVE
jgi:phosphate transport system substrate-binding protein